MAGVDAAADPFAAIALASRGCGATTADKVELDLSLPLLMNSCRQFPKPVLEALSAELRKSECPITHLDLSGFQFLDRTLERTKAAVLEIQLLNLTAVGMRYNRSLRVLRLRNCGLTTPQLTRLSVGLRDNHTLRKLDLWGNDKLNDQAVVMLNELALKNRCLEAVNLESCGLLMGSAHHVALQDQLARNGRAVAVATVFAWSQPEGTLCVFPVDMVRYILKLAGCVKRASDTGPFVFLRSSNVSKKK